MATRLALPLAGMRQRVVRVLPDVPAIDKTFDYVVPAAMDAEVRVGTMVRVVLGGRRVGGWVVEDDVEPPAGVALKPLAKVTGWGPPPDVVDLSSWVAWRWSGRRASVLTSATPPGAVRGFPPSRRQRRTSTFLATGVVAEAMAAEHAVVRLPPGADPLPLVVGTVTRGPTLVLAPTHPRAALVTAALRAAGFSVARLPSQWAQAAAGADVVVGVRSAVLAPVPDLQAVVVLDAHDETYQEERNPTWEAWEVAAERARRAGARCLIVSPCPTLEQLAWGRLITPSRSEERAGWPVVDLIDLTAEDPLSGLITSRVVELARTSPRLVVVLNRKGRARLVTCTACGAVATCEACHGRMAATEDGLRCEVCALERPAVCQACGATRLKRLLPGVTRLTEDLTRLSGRSVAEVTGDTGELPDADVLVGTEAVLRRATATDAVVFLEMDQELLAPRFRAGEQAMALLASAAALVGGRRGRVVVQTRIPHHEALQAALHADPGLLAAAEGTRRQALRLPPFAALASVSGEAAAGLVAGLPPEVEVMGDDAGRFLLRAPDATTLADALAAAPRPPGRLRVEVGPRRV